MKKLDNDFITLRNRVVALERKLEKKPKPTLSLLVINILLILVVGYGLHWCLVALGVGADL